MSKNTTVDEYFAAKADERLEPLKLEFHNADTDTDTDILAMILADTSDMRDFLKLFPWQAERHADILASARMSVSVSASWNASFCTWP